jgi:hypothetical protein
MVVVTSKLYRVSTALATLHRNIARAASEVFVAMTTRRPQILTL